jgi:transposase
MVFDELNNVEWASVAALIGDEPDVGMNRRGRPRVEPRSVANAVLWILTTREPWSKLPSYYPSGPTCRRRFAEWRTNGVLEEMSRVLARSGRVLPLRVTRTSPSSSTSVSRPEKTAPCVDTWGRVIWKSADSWKARGVTTHGGRSLDPIACMTHQLSGSSEQDSNAVHSRPTAQDNEQRSSMLQSLVRSSTEFDDQRGYVICAGFEQLSNGTYRAWSEIMKDRRRVERSGLIGPRFPDGDAAQQHALEWGRQWVARHCREEAAVVVNAAVTVALVSAGVAMGEEQAAAASVTSAATSILPGARAKMPRVAARCEQRAVSRDVSDRFPAAPRPGSFTRTDHSSARTPGVTAAAVPG